MIRVEKVTVGGLVCQNVSTCLADMKGVVRHIVFARQKPDTSTSYFKGFIKVVKSLLNILQPSQVCEKVSDSISGLYMVMYVLAYFILYKTFLGFLHASQKMYVC